MLSSKMQEPSTAHGHQHKTGIGHSSKPAGTEEYLTSSRDTLRSIAVAFDTTTTRLMKLNRMSSLTIFPGQTLYVPSHPDEVRSPSPPSECEDPIGTPPKLEGWDTHFTGEFSFLSPLSPSTSMLPDRPFKDLVMVSSKVDSQPNTDTNSNEVNNHKTASTVEKRRAFKSNKQDVGVKQSDAMRSSSRGSTDRQRVVSSESTESEPFEEGFLKMDVHYITENKEMVKGVMLVTPTALMFDPESDDPVIKRDGCDDYGIMCQMNLISSIAMYNDTSKMTPSQVSPTNDANNLLCSSRRSSTSTDTTTEAEADINETPDDIDTPDIPVEDDNDVIATSPQKSTWSPVHGNTLYEIKDKVPGSAKQAHVSKHKTDCSDSVSKLNEEKELNVMDPEISSDVSKDSEIKLENEFPFLHAVVKTVGDLIPGYEVLNTNEQLRTVAKRPNCNHMYLCIRARRRMLKTFSLSEDDDLLNLPSNNQIKEENKLPEYWFEVPRKRSDHLYAFFLQWSPENNLSDEAAIKLGFVVMDDEPYTEDLVDANENKKRVRSYTNSSLEFVDDFFDESYSFEKEWEIISIQEAKRRSVATNAIELAEADDSLVPELEKPSQLFNDSTLLSLCKCLPNRCVGYSWSPVYTTYDHGTSLKTLFRNMSSFEAPVVLMIQDSNDHIFGALCSNALHVSDHYYGTGESFLFTIHPHFEVFKWSGENSFFIKGDTDSLTLGGGKGTFGLWLDADLYRGCSHPCDTFKNKVLSSEEDFVIQVVEVWMIKDM